MRDADELYTHKQCEVLLEEKMQLLDESLDGKSFLVAERFSYADLVLYTRIESFGMLGVDGCLMGKKNIERWLIQAEQSVLRLASSDQRTTNRPKGRHDGKAKHPQELQGRLQADKATTASR